MSYGVQLRSHDSGQCPHRVSNGSVQLSLALLFVCLGCQHETWRSSLEGLTGLLTASAKNLVLNLLPKHEVMLFSSDAP
jgi:hypothetical protein